MVRNGQKIGVFEDIEKFGHQHFLYLVCNESLHYMLFSGIDRISGKNVVPETSTETLSANQIAGFWNQLYILNTTV